MNVSEITVNGLKLMTGTRIYYGGDIANESGFGTIMQIERDPQWGDYVTIIMDDGREIKRLPPVHFSLKYSGNGSTRFVTEEAYNKWRNAQMRAFKKLGQFSEKLGGSFAYLCPVCNYDVTDELETDYGIVCPSCHHDFWRSECERVPR